MLLITKKKSVAPPSGILDIKWSVPYWSMLNMDALCIRVQQYTIMMLSNMPATIE